MCLLLSRRIPRADSVILIYLFVYLFIRIYLFGGDSYGSS